MYACFVNSGNFKIFQETNYGIEVEAAAQLKLFYTPIILLKYGLSRMQLSTPFSKEKVSLFDVIYMVIYLFTYS
jgi:hypothetical protein